MYFAQLKVRCVCITANDFMDLVCLVLSSVIKSLTGHQHQKGHTVPKQV